MPIFWTYYEKLRDPQNETLVLDILHSLFMVDFISDDIIRAKILEKNDLLVLGEFELYDEITLLMTQHPFYAKFM